jgi:hypothetical protein
MGKGINEGGLEKYRKKLLFPLEIVIFYSNALRKIIINY